MHIITIYYKDENDKTQCCELSLVKIDIGALLTRGLTFNHDEQIIIIPPHRILKIIQHY